MVAACCSAPDGFCAKRQQGRIAPQSVYAAGLVFSNPQGRRTQSLVRLTRGLTAQGLEVAGYREVPIDVRLRRIRAQNLLAIRQVFVNCPFGMDETRFQLGSVHGPAHGGKGQRRRSVLHSDAVAAQFWVVQGLVTPDNPPAFLATCRTNASSPAWRVFHQRFSTRQHLATMETGAAVPFSGAQR